MIEEGFIPTGIPDDGPDMDQIVLEETGRELFDMSLEGPTRSPAWANGSGEQLAALPGALARILRRRKIRAPRTDLLLKQGLEAAEKPPEPPPGLSEAIDDLVTSGAAGTARDGAPVQPGAIPERGPTPFDAPEDMPEDYARQLAEQAAATERRTWARNINLDYVESEQDIGKVLDLNAEILGEVAHRSFAEVEAADIKESLAPILQGRQNGNLTDKQLLAGRRLLVTMTERVQELVDPITEGLASPAEILEFEKLTSQTVMLQKYMQGQIRETARALSAMRITAKPLTSRNTDAIMETINTTDTTATATVRAQILRDAMKTRADEDAAGVVADVSSQMYDLSTVRALANYWSASILTGFKTQAVNLISNAFVQILETGILKPTAAGIGGVRRAVTRSTDGISGAEALYEAIGARHALKDATLMAARVFWNGLKSGEYRSSYGHRKIDDITKQAPTLAQAFRLGEGVAGKSVDLYQRMVEAGSYGLLTAGDEFYKTIAYRKALYAQTAREGFEQGKRGDDLVDFMNERLANIDEQLHESAMSAAERQTFTNSPDGVLGTLARKGIRPAIQHIPALKFIMPFVDTPLNLFNYALEIGPTAPLTKSFREAIQAGGAQRDVALAQLTFGLSMTTLLAIMHQEGSITGAGPKSYGQRKALEDLGWRPYSIRLGNKWVSYNRGTDPLGMMMSAVTGYLDEMSYSRTEPEATEMFTGAVFAMAAYGKDATYLRGIGELMKLIDNRGRGADRFAASLLAGFVPRAFGTYQELTSDATVRTTYPSAGFWDALSKQMDARLDREELMPLRYWDGEIVTYGDGNALHLYNSLSPVHVMPANDDKGSERLVANGVSVLPPRPQVNIGGVTIDLFASPKGDELYDTYLEYVGKARREMVDKLVASASFRAMDCNVPGNCGPNSNQFRALNKAIDAGRRKGQGQFIQYLFQEVGKNVEEYGEIAQYFSADELKLLVQKARAGTLTRQEEEAISDMKIRGVSTRDEIPVPGYVGF